MWKNIYNYHVVPNEKYGIVSHAQLPTPLILNDRIRVFFASRDNNSYSSIYSIEITINNGCVKESKIEPVLFPGEIGTFDQHGVYPSEIKLIDGSYHLYYIGWNKGEESPLFYASVGLAISDDGMTFNKKTNSPILQRGLHDPCFVTSPSIISSQQGSHYMFYTSGIEWKRENELLQSYYHIKIAQSENLVDWVRNGNVAIPLGENETNVARGTVVQIDNKYCMYFCFVNKKSGLYQLGKAWSKDLINWTRDSTTREFDLLGNRNEMLAYPYVFHYKGELYLLYNSGRYGSTGFSLAIFSDN